MSSFGHVPTCAWYYTPAGWLAQGRFLLNAHHDTLPYHFVVPASMLILEAKGRARLNPIDTLALRQEHHSVEQPGKKCLVRSEQICIGITLYLDPMIQANQKKKKKKKKRTLCHETTRNMTCRVPPSRALPRTPHKALSTAPVLRLALQERANATQVSLVPEEIGLLGALGPEADSIRERVHRLSVAPNEGAAKVDAREAVLLSVQVGDLADVVGDGV